MDDKQSKTEIEFNEQDFSPASPTDFSIVNDRKVLRKMDRYLLPMITLLYLLTNLDRSNIGNAKIEGLSEDLHMTSSQFNWALTVFYFTYGLFELPSNLLLKKLRPSIWLPSIMVAWGIVITLTGLVQGYHGLLVARLFLGVAEAGAFPGAVYYISIWYRAEEAQYRLALFFSSATAAGAFSGLFAYAIAVILFSTHAADGDAEQILQNMNGVGGLAGWRWIFILEGILTVVVAIAAYFFIYDSPETATFLSEEERAWVSHRQKYQSNQALGKRIAENETFTWNILKKVSKDWQIYVSTISTYT